jgi:hypothetical protein
MGSIGIWRTLARLIHIVKAYFNHYIMFMIIKAHESPHRPIYFIQSGIYSLLESLLRGA